MRYLDALNEMTDAQRALKNRIMGRTSRGQMPTPGEHSTGGSKRGQKKEKGKKPEPSKHRHGRLLRTKKGPNPMKAHIAADDLVKDFTDAPKGKIPGPKPGQKLQVSHTEYRRIGALMAEALGLTPMEESRGAKSFAELFPGMTAEPVNTRGAGTRKTPMKNRDPLPAAQHNNPKAAKQARRDVRTPRTQQNIDPNDPNLNRASLKRDHIEYKRMGLLMAESLGYEIDEVWNVVVQGARALGTGIARGVGAAARGVGNLVTGAAKEKAKEKAMEKAMEKGEDVAKKVTGRRDDGNGVGRKRVGDMDHSQMGQNQMEAYKQIGMALAEVYSPEKHAKVTGGGQEDANRRYRRMRRVLRGRGISPIAGVEAVDKPGVTLSRAAREYRAARDSGAKRPTNLKPSYSK